MSELLSTDIRTIQTECFVGRFHHNKFRALHQHNCVEMTYVIKGSATHLLRFADGKEHSETIRAGDFFIIDYDVAHAFEDCSGDFLIINFLFHPSLIDPTLAGVTSFERVVAHPLIGFSYDQLSAPPVNRAFFDEDRQTLMLFEKAYKTFSKSLPGHEQLLRCYAIEIMISALQQLLPDVPEQSTNYTISSICDYVDEHYMEQITLTQICREKYFSLPYISKKFKKVCGVSFEQYLQQVRIQHACSLLLETNFTIDVIASHVNYTDTASFRNTFKRLVGKSPSEFRKLYNQ